MISSAISKRNLKKKSSNEGLPLKTSFMGTIGLDGMLFTILQAKFDQHLLKGIKKLKQGIHSKPNLTTRSRLLKLRPEI